MQAHVDFAKRAVDRTCAVLFVFAAARARMQTAVSRKRHVKVEGSYQQLASAYQTRLLMKSADPKIAK
jgi:hypothetical protein